MESNESVTPRVIPTSINWKIAKEQKQAKLNALRQLRAQREAERAEKRQLKVCEYVDS